jgi:hypothetical protein
MYVIIHMLIAFQPYYQPSPAPPTPFSINSTYCDPSIPAGNQAAWAMNVEKSTDIIIFGAGFYSFFHVSAITVNTAYYCISEREGAHRTILRPVYSIAAARISCSISTATRRSTLIVSPLWEQPISSVSRRLESSIKAITLTVLRPRLPRGAASVNLKSRIQYKRACADFIFVVTFMSDSWRTLFSILNLIIRRQACVIPLIYRSLTFGLTVAMHLAHYDAYLPILYPSMWYCSYLISVRLLYAYERISVSI